MKGTLVATQRRPFLSAFEKGVIATLFDSIQEVQQDVTLRSHYFDEFTDGLNAIQSGIAVERQEMSHSTVIRISIQNSEGYFDWVQVRTQLETRTYPWMKRIDDTTSSPLWMYS